MRRYLLLSAAAVLLAACAPKAPDAYTVKGEVEGFDGEALVVFFDENRQWTDYDNIDTLRFVDGRVDFRGTVRKSDIAQILYVGEDGYYAGMSLFMVEPGNLKISGNISDKPGYRAFVTGTPDNDRLTRYRKELERMTPDRSVSFTDRRDADARTAEMSLEFIEQNTDNAAGVFALSVVQNSLPTDQLEELAARFPARLDTIARLRNVRLELSKRIFDKGLTVGKSYMTTELIAPDGSSVELSSMVNPERYTLIDFWASWCGPCRAQIPRVQELHSEYDSAGLDVVGISTDDSMGDWLKALEEKELPWTQLKSPRVPGGGEDLYNITAIPKYVLIRPGGEIAALANSADEMSVRLAEIFR